MRVSGHCSDFHYFRRIFGFFEVETETFLRVTPLIPQFRRCPGFQKEAVRVTPENVPFEGVYSDLIIAFLADNVAPRRKAIVVVLRAK